ncbi:MAG: recombinase family protein [Candidatus Bathyarchaeota archaeon]|nr:recombinase family protein [Candidatus Bathyarchaeota archaeon]
MKNQKHEKIKVFLRRVSTENQSLEMQIAADKQFRDELDEDEYIEINELGVSANKVQLKQRKELVKLINLIEKEQVDTIYFYDRSRLTRNFYEYLELVDKFIAHKVKVVFTTTDANYLPFSSNYVMEGFNGILIEEEGKAIARRVADNHRKLPNKKYGYVTIKNENGKKSYSIISEHKQVITDLFKNAKGIESIEDFIEFLTKHSREMKKQPSDIIRITSDPFYAGCERIGSRYNHLPYVEPIIELELFSDVYKLIEPYEKRLRMSMIERSEENILHPVCGLCKKKMNYKKSHVGKTGIYTCSKRHKKVSINVNTYNQMMVQYSSLVLSNLNESEIEKKAVSVVTILLKKLEKELYSTNNTVEQLEMKLATMPMDKLITQQYKSEVLALDEVKSKRKEFKETILHCENYRNEIRNLVNKIRLDINENELINLISLIVKESFVYNTTLEIKLYFNEFLDHNKLERMVAD